MCCPLVAKQTRCNYLLHVCCIICVFFVCYVCLVLHYVRLFHYMWTPEEKQWN